MPTRNIDFAKLTLRDALDLAVWIEEEAKERYEDFAQQMAQHRTPEAARFFNFMAGNEEKHRAALAARRAKLFGDQPRTVDRELLFDVEAPEFDEARAHMTARSALATALRSEEKAGAFFTKARADVKDADVRALFAELEQEEVEHQQLVKKEIAKLPPDEPFRTEDFEDPPVAHD